MCYPSLRLSLGYHGTKPGEQPILDAAPMFGHLVVSQTRDRFRSQNTTAKFPLRRTSGRVAKLNHVGRLSELELVSLWPHNRKPAAESELSASGVLSNTSSMRPLNRTWKCLRPVQVMRAWLPISDKPWAANRVAELRNAHMELNPDNGLNPAWGQRPHHALSCAAREEGASDRGKEGEGAKERALRRKAGATAPWPKARKTAGRKKSGGKVVRVDARRRRRGRCSRTCRRAHKGTAPEPGRKAKGRQERTNATHASDGGRQTDALDAGARRGSS